MPITRSMISAVEVHTFTGAASESRGPFTPAGSLTSKYLRIATADGLEGFYGPIDDETLTPLLRFIGPQIIGCDALAITDVWHTMATHRHGRHGHYKMALSAVDNALWDLRGKAYDSPVWRLLGGGARTQVPVYASALGSALDEDSVARTALDIRDAGFEAQKWFPRTGPADGEAGFTRNISLIRTLRETLGDGADFMIDAGGSGWDLLYATRWSRHVAEFTPTWLEEPFRPDQLSAYRSLSQFSLVPLAAGEHLDDRSELAEYLAAGVLSAVQCDPEWCGGVTELVRMCALAATAGLPVMPHGHGLHAAIHVVASQPVDVCPKGEYLLNVMPDRHHFELDPLRPVDGKITVPDRPGFGILIDESKVQARGIEAA